MAKDLIAIAALAVFAALAIPAGLDAQPQIPVPTLAPTSTPAPTPTAASRPFACSCSTPGQPVVWAGQVVAPSFFLARQAAMGRCRQALGAKPISPFMPPPGSAFGPVVPTPAAPMFNPCSACACN